LLGETLVHAYAVMRHVRLNDARADCTQSVPRDVVWRFDRWALS
jgi:hypothetical protein